jgi:3-deoxy-D-manno-octulosonate 8-phosphate phosphatase (KDO 8-P phosphatase)
MISASELTQKIQAVRMLLLDVDGVLTDGRIIYHHSGEEAKVFHVRDGLGIRLLFSAGLEVGIATGRSSPALVHRCRNLGIKRIYDGLEDKIPVLERIAREAGVPPGGIAFVGDDLPDLGVMNRVGLALAVADAHEMVLRRADWITNKPGGLGAVREVCELILKEKGLWNTVTRRFDE